MSSALLGAFLALFLVSAPPARAESSWWHLASGTRPTYLHAGAGRDEVQELKVNASGGDVAWASESNPLGEHVIFPYNASATEVQVTLEAFYGAGNVEVTGGPLVAGTGNLIGPATGSGDLTSGSTVIDEVVDVTGEFAVGQVVEADEADGIPSGATVLEVDKAAETLTISKPATTTKEGALIGALGSKTVENVEATTGSFVPGQELSGAGITSGTKVEAVDSVSKTLTLSQAAAETETDDPVDVLGPYTIKFVNGLGSRPVTLPGETFFGFAGFFGGSNLEGTATVTQVASGRSDGQIVATVTNLGDAEVIGSRMPVTITDNLPPGLEAVDISGIAGSKGERGPVTCSLSPAPACTWKGPGPLPSYEQIEVVVNVTVEAGAKSGDLNEVTVSGGGTPSASLARPLTISSGPTPFGVENYELTPENEGGSPDSQAGSHPFQLTTTIDLNQTAETLRPPALPKDLRFDLPPGLVGNPTPLPECTDLQFTSFLQGGPNQCPSSTAIGVASVTLDEPHLLGFLTEPVPLFNLVPSVGEPARFGFEVQGVPVILDTAVRTGSDYGVVVSVHNIDQNDALLSSRVTLWGVPGDPRHDKSRGWDCLLGRPGCTSLGLAKPPPFLTLPTSCTAPLRTVVEADSWAQPGSPVSREYTFQNASGGALGLTGCNGLHFEPSISVAPDLQAASTPTGLTVGLHLPQEEATQNATGVANAAIKDSRVTLPEGVTLDPSGADGLGECSEDQIGFTGSEALSGRDLFTPGFPSCPDSSKVATATIRTPLLAHPLEGSVYLAAPYQNPFGSLLAIYLVAEDPVSGVLIKLAGEVSPDPKTGQLVSTFKETPDVPTEEVQLHFFGGDRAPLVTPPTCGPYTTAASFAPWSGNAEVESDSAFQITSGLSGGPCPVAGTPPFHPGLQAGVANNAAAQYSPLDLRITRHDDEQEITHFSLKLPPGLIGKLAGIPFCSDAQVAAAEARTGPSGGQEELEHPSCPQASEVGHTVVGAGVGSILTYVPGKLYLAGPYHGSALSIVSITAAKAGPFDLGTVVIREGLKVNPETAEVSVDAAGSDPIPHIIKGVPVHARDIQIYVDRPEFVLNPTSCEHSSIASTILGSGTDFASEADDRPVTVTSPFQAADCASLGFKPKLQVSLKGPTKRAGLPALKATVTYPKGPGYANIGRAVVTLPPSEFLEQGHIGNTCTRVQFNAGGGNGEQCPANSVLGRAVAITPLLSEPLEGPVFLRSNGGERKLPDLVAALHSTDINIDLVGFIDSRHKKGSDISQIRTTFAKVPDAPVTKFTLEMLGGKKGLLVNSTNLCKGTHKAIAEFTGQNGKLSDSAPAVQAQCGKKSHRKHAAHKHHGAGKTKGKGGR
jgi:hypothetical protein